MTPPLTPPATEEKADLEIPTLASLTESENPVVADAAKRVLSDFTDDGERNGGHFSSYL